MLKIDYVTFVFITALEYSEGLSPIVSLAGAIEHWCSEMNRLLYNNRRGVLLSSMRRIQTEANLSGEPRERVKR